MDATELLAGVAAPVAVIEPTTDACLVVAASPSFRCMMGYRGEGDADLLACALRFEPPALWRAIEAADGDPPAGAPPYVVAEGDFIVWSVGGLPFQVCVRRLATSAAPGRGRYCLTAERYGIVADGGPRDQFFFGQIVEHSPDIIAVIDRQYRHVFVNGAITEASGQTPEDFVGRDHRALGIPEELVQYFQGVYREVFETGQEGRKEFDFPAPDGSIHNYLSRVVPLPEESGETRVLLSYARDITERRTVEAERLALERKLQETQRLESLGLLAGGIAHDFNNILTSVLGMASLARAHCADAMGASALEQIERASLKAAELCNQMLAYAGRGQTLKAQLAMDALLGETRELLRGSLPKQVELRLSSPSETLSVHADRAQLQQVLMNLVLNAVESYGPQGGAVDVQVTRRPFVRDEWLGAVVAPEAAEGAPLACVTVEDHGAGMDAETLGKVFEPFFTTKFAGRGLGLAATLGIVRGHGGGLVVRSTPGEGTCFTLGLLVSEVGQAASVMPERPTRESSTGHVLVVDDEPSVRQATQLMVEALGFQVTAAPDGPSALKCLETPDAGFNMAVLDLTMPRMDGFELLRRLRVGSPDLPVVLMSGYVESDIRERFESDDDSGVQFLQKPFSLDALERALRRAAPDAPGR
ncbi:MAG: response regulator [Myxococcales bacterium]|nr:response regulator [Myxococcales bacterium]